MIKSGWRSVKIACYDITKSDVCDTDWSVNTRLRNKIRLSSSCEMSTADDSRKISCLISPKLDERGHKAEVVAVNP